MATIPDIGLGGLINSVRKLSGYVENPGYRAVDVSASFIAGMVAVLATDANGNPYLQVANATDTTAIIGLFYCHKTTSFYRSVIDEAHTFATAPDTDYLLYLSNANVKASSVRIMDTSTGVFTEGTDYSVNTTNGVITRADAGIDADEAVQVSYLYSDATLVGIDQTLGSNMAATLEGSGEVATLVYATEVAYALNGLLYSDANGYVTSTNGGGTSIGKVTKVPTSENPELHFRLSL